MEIFCDICAAMFQWMGIVNLTPDSFFEPSRVWVDACGTPEGEPRLLADKAMERIRRLVADGAEIVDLGAVSTRPGAADVPLEEEWRRLEPVLKKLQTESVPYAPGKEPLQISIDTTRSEIVRRAYSIIGPFIVNDISAGEEDPQMLPTVAELGLPFVAMHKRGNPRTMDDHCDYPEGVMSELLSYFADFERRAMELGIRGWILDPGLGFAKTIEQNWEILKNLSRLQVFGRPIMIGAADKRFTRCVPHGNELANSLAIKGGAAILRVHDIPK